MRIHADPDTVPDPQPWSKPWIRIGSGSVPVFTLKCWIQIRNQLIRLRNTGSKLQYIWSAACLGEKYLPSLVDSTSGLNGRVSSSSEGTWDEPARYTLFLESRRLIPAYCCCWDKSKCWGSGSVSISQRYGSAPKCLVSRTLDTRLDTTRSVHRYATRRYKIILF
jgi:hypothetical protein